MFGQYFFRRIQKLGKFFLIIFSGGPLELLQNDLSRPFPDPVNSKSIALVYVTALRANLGP